jgi:hypothetical protein
MWYGYALLFVTSTPQNIKSGGNSTCTNTWVCLDHISSVFLFVYILCPLRSAWCYTLGKEPFTRRCRWERKNKLHRGHRWRYISTAAVLPLLQIRYIKCISVCWWRKNDVDAILNDMLGATSYNILVVRRTSALCAVSHTAGFLIVIYNTCTRVSQHLGNPPYFY